MNDSTSLSLSVISSQLNTAIHQQAKIEARLRAVELGIAVVNSHPVEPGLRKAEERIARLEASGGATQSLWVHLVPSLIAAAALAVAIIEVVIKP